MPPVKKVVTWVVLAFVLYAIVTSPDAAAGIFTNAWKVISDGVGNVGVFFNHLLGR